jgi:uncharacterized membrane protein
MSGAALALALSAAGLHATWNLLLARARDVEAATAVALIAGVVAFAPVAAFSWDVEASAAPYIAGSAGLELVYFVLLAAAYSRSQLSVVYPVARGGAPVLVLLGALLLGHVPSGAEAAGVLLVSAGVLLVRGTGAWRGLVIAAVIASYTLVDNAGIEHAGPLSYLELVLAPVALVVAVKVGPARLRAALTPAAVAAGVASFLAYALALAALQLAPAAPVAAVRETSIVIAVALAGPVLRERVGPARLTGAGLVVAGVLLFGL